MLVSKQWIEQFTTVPKNITPEQMGEDLTLHVVEVEDVIDEAKFLEKIYVGRVSSVQKHPNADKLNICTVEFGEAHPAQVVCGGSNVAEGMLCAFGALGAQVRWHGEGDLIELKKAKIRDADSYGMICASSEIGLGEMFPPGDEKEILDLTSHFRHPERPEGVEGSRGKARDLSTTDSLQSSFGRDDVVGKPLAEALELEDIVFDIDNKSMTHRPDLWGQYGMAREVSAMYGTELKKYLPPSIGKSIGDWRLEISVDDEKACPRYMGLVVDGIEVKESPAWLKKRLMAVGMQSINNVVDVTNYVMLELGQPMHSFDASRLEIKNNTKQHQIQNIKINVRKAKAEETFVSLDEKEYSLTTDDLVIAIDDRVIALAGVKGSSNSGVTDETTTIVLESANFDAVPVRRTSMRHGLRTDASSRFEKALDPNTAELAMRRAVELIKQVCPSATVASTLCDQSNFSLNQGPIELDTNFVRRKMGVDLETKEMIRILESLGFDVKAKKDVLSVTVPTWRATKDIAIREDLIEEIARMYGYDNIEPNLPTFPIVPPVQNPLRELETTLRQLLAYEAGYTEVSNYSFVSGEWLKRLGIHDQQAYVELENPIAKDRPLLRRNLLPNMLQNVEQNLHRYQRVALFEMGKTFRKETAGEDACDGTGPLPKQDTILGFMFAEKGEETPFISLHGIIASIADRMGWILTLEKRTDADIFPTHPGRYANVLIDGTSVGRIGELHPQTADELGIPYRTAMMELNLSKIVSLNIEEKSTYQPLPQYPVIERDIAFLVDTSVEHDAIAAFLIEADVLTVNVELFDVFTGTHSAVAQSKIPEGKKSMAYRITYRSDEKTLEGGEVDAVHDNIVKQLEKKFDATVRT